MPPVPDRKYTDMKQFHEIGTTGLDYYAGWISEDPSTALRGRLGMEVYTKMSYDDPITGATLFSVDKMMREVSWPVKEAEDDSNSSENADFLESCMHDMNVPWSDFISEALTMLTHGFSLFEDIKKIRRGPNERRKKFVSQYSDNKIGWRKMAPRSQWSVVEGFKLGEDGGVEGVTQYAPPKYNNVFIPVDKLILFRTESRKNNPLGKSILRNAWKPWKYRTKFEIVEGIGVERDLAGLPLIYLPVEYFSDKATQDKKDVLTMCKRIVRSVRMDEQAGIVFPKIVEDGQQMSEFKLLSSGGRRAIDTGAIISRYALWQATASLADFIFLGHESVGSFALASTKKDLFTQALNAWLDHIADILNRVAVPRLFRANGIYLDAYPKITHDPTKKFDLNELANYIQKGMQTAGVDMQNQEIHEALLRIVKLPIPKGGAKPTVGEAPEEEPDIQVVSQGA